jgi:glycosyltransferase domain-containing protein
VLSICIPTYNRYEFLKWTVVKLKKLHVEHEIVISDNASEDDTKCIQLQGVRYFRQPENIGAFPNMRTALLEATGKYAVFCADDDYLLAEPLQQAIDYLEAHPEVSAYYAPCRLYQEVTQEEGWPAYTLNEPKTFTRSDPTKLFNFVIHNHVWPEHAVYRTEHLAKILEPRIRSYWAFIDLANALSVGDVHFSTHSFYRNIMDHPIGHRVKLGDQQCLTDFDEYRGGLEIMAFKLFNLVGQLPVPDVTRKRLSEMIQHFICIRLGLAHNLMARQGRTEEAEELRMRLEVCAPAIAA